MENYHEDFKQSGEYFWHENNNGSFDIKTKSGKVGANWKYCQLLQRDDGYEYSHAAPKKTKDP